MLTLLLACSTGADPIESGPDSVAAKLTETTDFCAWDGGELTDTEPVAAPEGYIGDLWPYPYQPCLDGLFTIQRRLLDHPDGRLDESFASSTFFSVSVVDEYWQSAVWLDAEEGDDDCGLAVLSGDGLYDEGDLVWLDPGGVDLLMPSQTVALDRAEGGQALNWDSYLSDAGISAEYGGSFGLSVEGSAGGESWDGFAAIELPDLVALPEQMEVTSPSPLGPGVALPRADLDLQWTGTSDTVVEIELYTRGKEAPWYLLRCAATDDGAFTVPGALLAELPADSIVSLYLTRQDDSWVGTSAGRSIHARGLATYEAWDLALP